jgi:hypothetical protein
MYDPFWPGQMPLANFIMPERVVGSTISCNGFAGGNNLGAVNVPFVCSRGRAER